MVEPSRVVGLRVDELQAFLGHDRERPGGGHAGTGGDLGEGSELTAQRLQVALHLLAPLLGRALGLGHALDEAAGTGDQIERQSTQ